MTNQALTKQRGWDERQVKAMVTDAIEANKAAWELVPTLRTAILAQKFVMVVTGLDRESVPTAYLDTLWSDMCAWAEKYRGLV